MDMHNQYCQELPPVFRTWREFYFHITENAFKNGQRLTDRVVYQYGIDQNKYRAAGRAVIQRDEFDLNFVKGKVLDEILPFLPSNRIVNESIRGIIMGFPWTPETDDLKKTLEGLGNIFPRRWDDEINAFFEKVTG